MAAPKLILAPCVEDELWSIWKFIAKDNPDAATRVVDRPMKLLGPLPAYLHWAGSENFPIYV